MGAVRFSIDPGLVRQLVSELPLEVFVETGTYEGASVRAVAPFFNEIHTIEVDDELYARAESAFAGEPAVHVHHGRSQDVLEELTPKLKRRKTLFWLDAHWSDQPASAGQEEGCPLLKELALIGSLRRDSVVMIDDARFFLAPPPAPIDPDEWPSLEQVLERLQLLSKSHEPMVIDDVIVFFPSKAKEAVRQYARENAADWFAELGRARETNLRLDRLETQLEAIPQQLIPAQITELEEGIGQRFESIQNAIEELSTGSTAMQDAMSQMRLVEARQEIRALERRLGDLGSQLEALQRGSGDLSEASKSTQDAIAEARAAGHQEAQELLHRLEAFGPELDRRLGALGSQLQDVQEQRPQIEQIQRQLHDVQEHGPRLEQIQQQLRSLQESGPQVEQVRRQLQDLQEQRLQLEQIQQLLGGLQEGGPQLEQIQRQLTDLQERAPGPQLDRVSEQLRDVQRQGSQIEAVRRQLEEVQEQGEHLGEIRRQLQDLQVQRAHIEQIRRQLQEVRAQRPHIEEVQRLVTIIAEPVLARKRRRQRAKRILLAPARGTAAVLAPVARPLRPLWARIMWLASASRHHFGVWLSRVRLEPKLGRLEHHPPTELDIPKRYLNSQPPANPPSISIVTPSYNQAAFLERTIQSVVDQDYPCLEYIVQDGNSNDRTGDVLERYGSQLEHWEMREDDGQAQAINRGFSHATGEVMAYLNSDDVLLPGSLRYVGRYFEAHPEVDVIYGHRVLIDERDREIGRWVLPRHRDSILSWADFVPQETLFWRRRAWEAAGGRVDEEFRFAIDWDLLLRLRDAGARIVRVPRFLGAFRVHTAQKTTAELDLAGAREMARIRSRVHRRDVRPEEVSRHLRGYLRRHVALHKLYRAHLIRY